MTSPEQSTCENCKEWEALVRQFVVVYANLHDLNDPLYEGGLMSVWLRALEKLGYSQNRRDHEAVLYVQPENHDEVR